MILDGKRVLVTGGTGSMGKTFVRRVLTGELGTPRKAVMACIPLTVVMLIYTAISLSIIAEPMVKFGILDSG